MFPQSTHSRDLLILDPTQPRQLAPRGSFVLWRRQRGRDQGLLGTTTSALEPEHHQVRISCAVIDPFVIAVSVADARVLFPGGPDDHTPALEGPQADVTVDLARGRVIAPEPGSTEIALWLGQFIAAQ